MAFNISRMSRGATTGADGISTALPNSNGFGNRAAFKWTYNNSFHTVGNPTPDDITTELSTFFLPMARGGISQPMQEGDIVEITNPNGNAALSVSNSVVYTVVTITNSSITFGAAGEV